MNTFQLTMIRLDGALTGSDQHAAAHTVESQPDNVEDCFTRGEWYLSDGGYSRVWLSEEKIFLTPNSTDRVKAKWDAARPQVDAVRALIQSYFAGHGVAWGTP